MPMPQYNGPMYAQGPTAVGPYNLQGYQPTFGYNPQQTYMPQTPQPVPSQEPMAIPHLIGRSISANDQIPPKEIPSDGSPAYFPMQDGSAILVKVWTGNGTIQSVNTMLNGINSGICSLGYDVASQINGVNTNIMQNSYNTANAITQAQFAQQQSAAALQAQLADCCCQNREAISGVNYNMATSTNAVTTAICNAARDITENQNTNYRQLHDELVAYRMEDKDNTIAELRSQVNALNLSASQSNQNAYLVAQLKTPAPVPAYTVPNPNGYYGCQQNCYQSCGC